MKNDKQEKLVKLDKRDRQILNEISLNARRPLKEIGRSIGMSEQVLGYRLKELTRKGVISGFIPFVRIDKLGLNFYRGFFRISKATREREKEIMQLFLKNKNVIRLARIGWRWDLAVDFVSKDADFFSKLLKDTIGEYAENLKSYTVLIPVNFYRFKRGYLTGKKTGEQVCDFKAVKEKEKLDKTDYRILKVLSKNARATNHKIGKETNLAPSTVKKRMESMEEREIIQDYGAVIRPWIFGGIYQNVLLKVYEINDAESRLFEFAKAEPNIVTYFRTMARNYSLEIECNNKQEFVDLMRKLKHSFADVLYDYEVIDVQYSNVNWSSMFE